MTCLLLGTVVTQSAAAEPGQVPPPEQAPFTRIGDILRLGREPENNGRPVDVSGVITYFEPNWKMAFVQDDSGGIYFMASTTRLLELGIAHGKRVAIRGTAHPGLWRPVIGGPAPSWNAENIQVLGTAPMPDPLPVPPERLNEVAVNSQWVEVKGVVRSMELIDDRASIDLEVGTAASPVSLKAFLPGYASLSSLPRHLLGLTVAARGVLAASFDSESRFQSPRLMIPSISFLTPSAESLAKLLQVPLRDTRHLDSSGGESERVHLRGYATVQFPGTGFFLSDATGSAWIETPQTAEFSSGDELEVVGVRARVANHSFVRDAFVSRTGKSSSKVPRIVAGGPRPAHGEWVTVQGLLVDSWNGTPDSLLRIRLPDGMHSVRVQLQGGDAPNRWSPGSRLQITGVAVDGDWPVMAAGRSTADWRLLVDSPASVVVLSPPSWWTTERLATVAIAFGLSAAAAGAWVLLLRRQVRIHSSTIAEQRERSVLAEERGRISREFHDSLEQHLTGLAIQLEAVAVRIGDAPAETRRLVDIARQMVRHGHDEARAAIWELRARALSSGGLIAALEELLPLVASGSSTRIEVESKGDCSALPPSIEHHFLRIAQEAVTNAIKHSGATHVRIAVEVSGGDARLVVSDDGCGFAANTPSPGERPRFGLMGMRERAARIAGQFDLQSRLQQGTAVIVTVRLTPNRLEAKPSSSLAGDSK